ncbi:hypothetical protein EN817_21265 [Mesorhizobium sp. M3A.F.Ca.ET.174.01.1.1]|nr:hypothetical protein EJ074_17770 [Mesorhizobium sp. M3A.F.Ca.ET.080.04.2.1]RWB70640.1 MAG: hypothetical protein EOQ49_17660 [Mesorhizobium sp.]TGS70632.1 hypothetical protein EN844_07825 [Mesorhizobium sp. M3A.F.Ca.ET.201.01.1.1]TGS85562.1 hypothetical protein EN818_19120 [Mesorhizobium sp. M3A.F.Ca.ET.175.01.1.1]TGT23507.1 hypothetical protein EN817_21265 [Mesorhizobium sp. M3A.F.Ca.ET.174.01.1.1]TGT57039.1 hypothetical protein EN813_039710 [Mesorhizobium sp. M00.F.Ca.ET.170.01.1.1]
MTAALGAFAATVLAGAGAFFAGAAFAAAAGAFAASFGAGAALAAVFGVADFAIVFALFVYLLFTLLRGLRSRAGVPRALRRPK